MSDRNSTVRMCSDYLKRSEDVVIPCRPNSDGRVKVESDLTSEKVTWTDAVGHDLDLGRVKVDTEKRLVLSGVREMDAGIYVCRISKVTNGDEVTNIRHVVRLNGTVDILRF